MPLKTCKHSEFGRNAAVSTRASEPGANPEQHATERAFACSYPHTVDRFSPFMFGLGGNAPSKIGHRWLQNGGDRVAHDALSSKASSEPYRRTRINGLLKSIHVDQRLPARAALAARPGATLTSSIHPRSV